MTKTTPKLKFPISEKEKLHRIKVDRFAMAIIAILLMLYCWFFS